MTLPVLETVDVSERSCKEQAERRGSKGNKLEPPSSKLWISDNRVVVIKIQREDRSISTVPKLRFISHLY